MAMAQLPGSSSLDDVDDTIWGASRQAQQKQRVGKTPCILSSPDQEPSCWPGLGRPEALFQALMVSPVRGGQASPVISPIDNPRDARSISQE